MNEHTTLDPTTGTDNSFAARKARADAFFAKVDESNKRPREGWDTHIDLAPIRH